VLILRIPTHSKYGGLGLKVDVGIAILNWVVNQLLSINIKQLFITSKPF
jgi:hypothetical protein